jgi:hypothetical protein
MEIGENSIDRINLEHESRHIGVAGVAAFRQRLREHFDGISLPERTKERRFPMEAAAGAAHGVAARTVVRQEVPTAPLKSRRSAPAMADMQTKTTSRIGTLLVENVGSPSMLARMLRTGIPNSLKQGIAQQRLFNNGNIDLGRTSSDCAGCVTCDQNHGC